MAVIIALPIMLIPLEVANMQFDFPAKGTQTMPAMEHGVVCVQNPDFKLTSAVVVFGDSFKISTAA